MARGGWRRAGCPRSGGSCGSSAASAARSRSGPWARAARARRIRGSTCPAACAIAFGHLGPTYIKLGQIVSGGEGLFPEELVSEFKLLRDRVPPESFDDVRRVVELELGRSLDDVFASFERTPIAAASIAQVHAARLRTGEEVVVKVQRPQIARLVREDIEAMSWLAPHLVGRIPVAALANPPALIELFAETIVEELDFRLEAENMLDIARVLAETEQRATIVPRPHPTLVTRRVLVMERLDGIPWDDVQAMHAAGVDTEAVLHAGLVSFMEGAMLYGVFHGDLHGGNLMVRPDGRTVLMDFGITGRLDETQAHGVPDAARRRHEPATRCHSSERCATSVRSRPTPTSKRCSATSVSIARSTPRRCRPTSWCRSCRTSRRSCSRTAPARRRNSCCS